MTIDYIDPNTTTKQFNEVTEFLGKGHILAI